MTTSSASARPYSVFVELPQFILGLVACKNGMTYVDKGLKPGQLDAFSAGESRIKTTLACIAASLFFWVLPAAIGVISLISALAARDYTRLGVALGLSLAGIIAIVVSSRYINRRQKHYSETASRLADQLVPAPRDGRRDDLCRIQKALSVLQAEHGTDYDERAQEAVAAVLDQDRQRPNQKHLIIADSAADDSDSVAIRARTLAAKAAWSGDVAHAEHLVLALEDAAAGKVPAAA